LDDIFPDDLLRAVTAEIRTGEDTLEKNHYGTVQKHRISDISRFGPTTRRLIEELNSAPFLKFLEKLTGIEALVSDPLLEGGGVHQIAPGGFLKVHTDFNWHRILKLHRRINILIYLNEGWQEEWNGHLELWSETMDRCGARVAPVFNRMVVFSTTDKSYHGHPDVLSCPDDVRRNSIALYYYTATRPSSEVEYGESTLTNYRERPDEIFSGGKLKHRLHQAMLRFPFFRKAVQLVRR
jgi:Rps23 Pro-64 3,4-dihydroxylase Tpa1-like proline 4-hydroxylase